MVTPPVSIPISLNECLASWYLLVELRRAFDGIHPTLRQVPPSFPLPSMQTVFKPSCPALIAATYPIPEYYINDKKV
jgi:hypothetical protein